MPELPERKVGIVACSGEELAEGTVTRLAALRVLEQLRPGETVTICLPLFLAGGEGDRAFARFYPTIAVDGCDKRCAARATEQLSGKPAASVVVSDLLAEHGLDRPEGARRLDESGRQAVEVTADRVAGLVDELLGGQWNRRSGSFVEAAPAGASPRPRPRPAAPAGPGIPVQTVDVDGRAVPLAALPLIFEQFRGAGKAPGAEVTQELLATVKIYNDVPAGTDEALRGRAGARVRRVLRPGAGPAMSRTATYHTTVDLDRRALGADRAGQRPGDGLLRPARRPGPSRRADARGCLRRRGQHLRDDDVHLGDRAVQARPAVLRLPGRGHEAHRARPDRDLHPPAAVAADRHPRRGGAAGRRRGPGPPRARSRPRSTASWPTP